MLSVFICWVQSVFLFSFVHRLSVEDQFTNRKRYGSYILFMNLYRSNSHSYASLFPTCNKKGTIGWSDSSLFFEINSHTPLSKEASLLLPSGSNLSYQICLVTIIFYVLFTSYCIGIEILWARVSLVFNLSEFNS